MTKEERIHLFERIDQLEETDQASFGKLTVQQVLPHCADQFRMAFGEKSSVIYDQQTKDDMRAMAKRGEDVPTPQGFGQVEGDGTPPTTFENDKKILKERILEFCKTPDDHLFSDHPYFGPFNKAKWSRLMVWHLNHHLVQFGV